MPTVTSIGEGGTDYLYWVDFCRSYPRVVLVESDVNDWSGRMQMGGQVCAITQIGGGISISPAENEGVNRLLILATYKCVEISAKKPGFAGRK
jgi:hypothetical protein